MAGILSKDGEAGEWNLQALHLPCLRLLVSEKEPCVHVWCPEFYGCCAEDISLDSLALVASKACVHGFNTMVTNKEKSILSWLVPQRSVQRKQTEMSISQPFPERGIFAYFKIFLLRVQLPSRLPLGTDWDLPLWDTDRCLDTFNYWEPVKTKNTAWTITKKQPRARAQLNNKAHLLHKTTHSRLG